MKTISKTKSWKPISFLFSTIILISLGALPSWANEGPSVVGEDATQNIIKVKAQTPWFYWPGWAFLGLTSLVLAIMAYSWYKLIYIPKYRGRKIAQ